MNKRIFWLALGWMGMWVLGTSGTSQIRSGPVNEPGSWEPVGLSGGGGMFIPAISPADSNLMMLNCDMSAAYLSEDGGHNWRMINHAQLRSDTRCRPAFHPTNPNVIFASSGGRLHVSRDRGKSFTPIGNLRDSLFGEIAMNPDDPNVMLAGTRSSGCALSRDAGVTWRICHGPVGRLIAFHFDRTRQGRTIFAATDQGLWRSDDAGQTWIEKTLGLPWMPMQAFAGGSDARANVVMLYCAIPSKNLDGVFKGGIYRSRDRGESWQWAMGSGLNMETKQADQWAYGPIAQYNYLLATDAQPLTVYALNTATGFHPPHSDTVFRSDDGGATWRATYFQDPRFQQFNVAHDFVTASTGQCFKGGETPFGVAICNSDPDRLMLVRNEPHITHNGGRSLVRWQHLSCLQVNRPVPKRPGSATGSWSPPPGTTTSIPTNQTGTTSLTRTSACRAPSTAAKLGNGGTRKPGRRGGIPVTNWLSIPMCRGKIWGAFSDVHDIPNDNIISERHGHNRPGGVCISRDFGTSWKCEAKGLPLKPVTSIVLDPRSAKGARTLYAGVFDAGVFKSTDDGQTWTLKKNGLGHPNNMRVYRVILHADGTLFASICAKRPFGRQAADARRRRLVSLQRRRGNVGEDQCHAAAALCKRLLGPSA